MSKLSGLGQGLMRAGDLASQAIMGRHEEKERQKQQAFQNMMAQQQLDFQQDQAAKQHARQIAADTFNRLQIAPKDQDVTSLYPELRNNDPIAAELFTRPEMTLGSRPISGMTTGSEGSESFGGGATQGGDLNIGPIQAPAATGRRLTQQPYNYRLEQEGIKQSGATDRAQIRALTAVSANKLREQANDIRRLAVQQSDVNSRRLAGVAIQRIEAALQMNDDDNANRVLLANQAELADWGLGIGNVTGVVPGTAAPQGVTPVTSKPRTTGISGGFTLP